MYGEDWHKIKKSRAKVASLVAERGGSVNVTPPMSSRAFAAKWIIPKTGLPGLKALIGFYLIGG
jgi:hypothetical protein